jgi:hypothetical protein
MGDNRYTVKFEGKKICAVGCKFGLKKLSHTNGCSIVDFELIGGCQGQGKVLSAILNGADVVEMCEKFAGIKCGDKPTSCINEVMSAIANKVAEVIE